MCSEVEGAVVHRVDLRRVGEEDNDDEQRTTNCTVMSIRLAFWGPPATRLPVS